ncbi:hypothetical protein MRB53_037353 [Persea americana]|nr:hypothetical protein MRB53_037353 [Persea americana]
MPLSSEVCPVALTPSRILIGAVIAWSSLCATLGSSIFSNATSVIEMKYHIGPEVGTLATSLFVAGYASGPIVWGPFSELQGPSNTNHRRKLWLHRLCLRRRCVKRHPNAHDLPLLLWLFRLVRADSHCRCVCRYLQQHLSRSCHRRLRSDGLLR